MSAKLLTKIFKCCELLDSLGVPYIKSAGEAEAMCAALDAAGVSNREMVFLFYVNLLNIDISNSTLVFCVFFTFVFGSIMYVFLLISCVSLSHLYNLSI